jgi:hypothetical protein
VTSGSAYRWRVIGGGYGHAQAQAWDRLHPRLTHRGPWLDHDGELPLMEGTVIRLQVEYLPADRDPKPVWLWSSLTDPTAELVDLLWQVFLRRFDLEHTFRLFKQTLGWTRPKLRDPESADRWVSAGHSVVGIVLAAVSVVMMPVLSAAQRWAGRELGSASAVADSHQTLLCTYLSGVLLVGLLLNGLPVWWWLIHWPLCCWPWWPYGRGGKPGVVITAVERGWCRRVGRRVAIPACHR